VTVSHWRRTGALGTVRTEVAVVGAGVCGISAALELLRRGVGYVVIVRGSAGEGACTRNAGFLMRGAAENYRAAIDLYGRELARTVWRWTEETLEGLRAEGIGALPTYQRVPSCLLALGAEERDQLLEAVGLLREDGFAAEWVARGEDTAWRCARPLGGLINPGDAAVNSYDLIRFLRGKLAGAVLERQEVAEVLAEGEGVRLRLSDGWVVAPRVLLCTNAYVPLLAPGLAGVVAPRRGQMLALANAGMRLDASYYANHGYEYFRQTTDGTVVVGGCRKRHAEAECGWEDRTTPAVQADLEAFACAALGISSGALRVTSRWAGTMGFTPDSLPVIGPVPGAWGAGAVWFCGGFTGHGMSIGHRCARAAVAGMLDGEANPFPLGRFFRA
jgi:glycine/D-amino acid oxidase-like deaminating enzyme